MSRKIRIAINQRDSIYRLHELIEIKDIDSVMFAKAVIDDFLKNSINLYGLNVNNDCRLNEVGLMYFKAIYRVSFLKKRFKVTTNDVYSEQLFTRLILFLFHK